MILKINDGRSGSAKALTEYLEKEQDMVFDKDLHQPFVDQDNNELTKEEAAEQIDNNHGKLGGKELHYYHLTLNPSNKEMEHLANSPEKLREFTHQAMDEYAKNFKKDTVKSHTDLVYNFKIENFRWDTKDEKGNELKKWGKDEQGNRVTNWKKKEGMHVHITLSHNTKSFKGLNGKGKEIDKWAKVSPNNTWKKEFETSNTIKNTGFHRVGLSHKMEQKFDAHTKYQRPYEETLDYYKTMKSGILHVEGIPKKEKGKSEEQVLKDAIRKGMNMRIEANKNKSIEKAPTFSKEVHKQNPDLKNQMANLDKMLPKFTPKERKQVVGLVKKAFNPKPIPKGKKLNKNGKKRFSLMNGLKSALSASNIALFKRMMYAIADMPQQEITQSDQIGEDVPSQQGQSNDDSIISHEDQISPGNDSLSI